jgi:hypothetical protein
MKQEDLKNQVLEQELSEDELDGATGGTGGECRQEDRFKIE